MRYLDKAIQREISAEETAMTLEEARKHIENFKNWELLYQGNMGYHLVRTLKFNENDEALEYIEKLKELTKELHSTPRITIKGNQVHVDCHTFELKGLHLNDFIIAAYVDDLYGQRDVNISERDIVAEASNDSFPASDPPGY